MRGWVLGVTLAVTACSGGDGDSASGTVDSVPVGDFTERWSVQLEGVERTWPTDDVIYVTVGGNPDDSTGSQAITGVDADDGDVRWTTKLTDDGSWSTSFVLFPTNSGALVSYDDAKGGHLVLLDEASVVSNGTRLSTPAPTTCGARWLRASVWCR